jgi:hypothetical protein
MRKGGVGKWQRTIKGAMGYENASFLLLLALSAVGSTREKKKRKKTKDIQQWGFAGGHPPNY